MRKNCAAFYAVMKSFKSARIKRRFEHQNACKIRAEQVLFALSGLIFLIMTGVLFIIPYI